MTEANEVNLAEGVADQFKDLEPIGGECRVDDKEPEEPEVPSGEQPASWVDEIEEKYAAFEREQIAAGKVCGSCELFTDEDMNGKGWCQFFDGASHCSETCQNWSERSK